MLACSATGSGNFTATWQNVLNVLEFGMSPNQAARTPNVYGGAVESAGFPTQIIDGVPKPGVRVVERHSNSQRGYWVGVRIDPGTGTCEGGKVPVLNGIVMSEE